MSTTIHRTKAVRVGPAIDREKALAESADKIARARSMMFESIDRFGAAVRAFHAEFPHDTYVTDPDQIIREIGFVLTRHGVPRDGTEAVDDGRRMC